MRWSTCVVSLRVFVPRTERKSETVKESECKGIHFESLCDRFLHHINIVPIPEKQIEAPSTRDHMFFFSFFSSSLLVVSLVGAKRYYMAFCCFVFTHLGSMWLWLSALFLCISNIDHSNDMKDFVQSCAHYITGERTYVLQRSISSLLLLLLILSFFLSSFRSAYSCRRCYFFLTLWFDWNAAYDEIEWDSNTFHIHMSTCNNNAF